MNRLFLFIHGLGGKPTDTWGHFPTLVANDQLGRSEFYKYPTNLIRLPLQKRVPAIESLAGALRTEIDSGHKDESAIVLVCHSLGGVVARKYLADEVANSRKLRVTHLILYAAPINGARLASIGNLISWRHRQLKQLCKKSRFLEQLNEKWNEHNLSEKLNVLYVLGSQDSVVDHRSASFGATDEQIRQVNKDHRGIVKPTDKRDTIFTVLRDFVELEPKEHGEREIATGAWHTYFMKNGTIRQEQAALDPKGIPGSYVGVIKYKSDSGGALRYSFEAILKEGVFTAMYSTSARGRLDCGAWVLDLAQNGDVLVGLYVWLVEGRQIGSDFYQWSRRPLEELVSKGDSDIHEKGVYADLSLATGALAGIFRGSTSDQPTKHSLFINKKHVDPDTDCLLRFLNHSCEPNAKIEGDGLFLTNHVEAGSELTINYQLTESAFFDSFPCNCGHCEGVNIGSGIVQKDS